MRARAFGVVEAGGLMYKRILCPIDGSPRAEKILPHVEPLAPQGKSPVILLELIEPAAAGFTPSVSMMVTPPPQELELYWKSLKAAEEGADEYLEGKAKELEQKRYSTE